MLNNNNSSPTPPDQRPEYMSTDDKNGQYVYLMEAKGYYGLFSFLIKRRKIGLSNNPERRLKELNSEQAPCPIIGIRFIEVVNSRATEADLHQVFKKNRRHGEWFAFWVWELPYLNFMYERKAPGTFINRFPGKEVVVTFAVTFIGTIAFIGGLAATGNLPSVRYQTVPIEAIDSQGVRE
jgi:hypothetical protein